MNEQQQKEFIEAMNSFNDVDLDNKIRLTIETMVFCGYDIIDFCKNWKSHTTKSVSIQYRKMIAEKICQ